MTCSFLNWNGQLNSKRKCTPNMQFQYIFWNCYFSKIYEFCIYIFVGYKSYRLYHKTRGFEAFVILCMIAITFCVCAIPLQDNDNIISVNMEYFNQKHWLYSRLMTISIYLQWMKACLLLICHFHWTARKTQCVSSCLFHRNTKCLFITVLSPLASSHICKIGGCACAGNAGNVFPTTAS